DYAEVLARGNRTKVGGADAEQILLFERTHEDESVYVGLNLKEEAQNLQLELNSAEAVVIDHYSGQTYETTSDQIVTISIPSVDQGGTVLLEVVGGTIADTGEQSDDTTIPENMLRVHYENKGDFSSGLGLWTWEDVEVPSEQTGSWPDAATPFTAERQTEYGAYVDVLLVDSAKQVGMLINNSAGDNLTGDIMVRSEERRVGKGR